MMNLFNSEVIRINQDCSLANPGSEIDNNSFFSEIGGEFHLNASDHSAVQELNTKDPSSFGEEFKYTLRWEGDDTDIVSIPLYRWV